VVEAEVNARIRENAEVTTRLMTPEAAVAEGAMALFGEKYGDEVRVVAMGEGDEGRGAYSIELCGGTHVRRTGDIGLFRITGEGAVSAGVRRVEAVTGAAAMALLAENDRHMEEVATLLRANPAEIPGRVTALMEDRKRLERLVSELQRKLATGNGAPELEDIGGVQLAARNVGEIAGKELKGLVDAIAQQVGSGVVALVSTADGKASIAVGVSPDLVKRISAVDLVRAASAAVGGKGGGGRPEMAQAGGPDPERADEALDAIRQALADILARAA
jgi:alanyl-tRNA synthetase